MPNYNLVLDAKFKPFSYQELLAPVMAATQAHQDIENQYGELAAKANVWENMANEQTDPYAYKMYKTYANDLEEQAGQLAREGLTPISRRNMYNMRTRYSREITPIEQAYTMRQKQAEEQQKALLQDPTLLLSRRASTTSLDDYIRNPQLDYKSYSGKLLTAQAASAASALAKEMQENPREWRDILGKSYYETLMQKGFSSQAVLQAIQDNPEAAPQLTRIVEDIIDSSGIREWRDQHITNRAIDYAKQGLWNAVGETQYQVLDNWRAKMAAQEAMEIRRENRKRQEEMTDKLAINPLNIYSSRELSDAENKYNKDMKEYSKYFYNDNGKWKMNYEGWKEYNRKVNGITGKPMTTPEGITILTEVQTTYSDTPFKKFIDSLGMKGMSSEAFGNWQSNTAGSLWGEYAENSPMAKTSRYDATKVTEYDYSIAGNQRENMKDAIITASKGLNLKEVDYDNKSGKFEGTGDELSLEDFKDDKYEVVATRFSPYGSSVIVQDDNGNTRRFELPPGVNPTNEANRDSKMAEAQLWQQVINTGQYPDEKGNVHQASPYELAFAQQQYEQALQQAYFFHSQLGVQNKTKEQEFKPRGY